MVEQKSGALNSPKVNQNDPTPSIREDVGVNKDSGNKQLNETNTIKTNLYQLVDIEKREVTPVLPEEWNYDESVDKVRKHIFKWKNLTKDIIIELWTAKQILSGPGRRTDLATNITRLPTWSEYCQKVGVHRNTVERWFKDWMALPTLIIGESVGDVMPPHIEENTKEFKCPTCKEQMTIVCKSIIRSNDTVRYKHLIRKQKSKGVSQ